MFFTLIVPPAFENLYETQQERDAITETMVNPAITAMLGTGDFDNYTTGAMTAHNMLVMTAVIVGLKIGRASCRERGEMSAGAGGADQRRRRVARRSCVAAHDGCRWA